MMKQQFTHQIFAQLAMHMLNLVVNENRARRSPSERRWSKPSEGSSVCLLQHDPGKDCRLPDFDVLDLEIVVIQLRLAAPQKCWKAC